jgi:hypothetical protein
MISLDGQGPVSMEIYPVHSSVHSSVVPSISPSIPPSIPSSFQSSFPLQYQDDRKTPEQQQAKKPDPQSLPWAPREELEELLRQIHYNETHPDKYAGLYSFPFDIFELLKFSMIFGARECGKSTFLDYFLWRLRHRVHTCVVICPSEASNGFYARRLPNCLIHPRVNDELFTRIKTRNERLKTSLAGNGQLPPGCKSPEVMVIADDVIQDQKALKSEAFREAIFVGRHFKEGMILLSQSVRGVEKKIRDQLDYCFFQRYEKETDIRTIYDEYGSAVYPDYDMFRDHLLHYTQNYGTFILKMKDTNSSALKDRAFYCNSIPEVKNGKRLLPDYKLDSGTMWEMAEVHQLPPEEIAPLDYSDPDITDYYKVTQGYNNKYITSGPGGSGRSRRSRALPSIRLTGI